MTERFVDFINFLFVWLNWAAESEEWPNAADSEVKPAEVKQLCCVNTLSSLGIVYLSCVLRAKTNNNKHVYSQNKQEASFELKPWRNQSVLWCVQWKSESHLESRVRNSEVTRCTFKYRSNMYFYTHFSTLCTCCYFLHEAATLAFDAVVGESFWAYVCRIFQLKSLKVPYFPAYKSQLFA